MPKEVRGASENVSTTNISPFVRNQFHPIKFTCSSSFDKAVRSQTDEGGKVRTAAFVNNFLKGD